ncbi:hypothetical protein F383_04289 [Gossypium arboreum]|uniref:Uncharacterized protein n=1 Tax=Gossypium arboreum TaxID=29729 RepID=A0A0B0P6C3_GOSAR|nr:hypothetical protein F383_04289 [Gossypium arboreum]
MFRISRLYMQTSVEVSLCHLIELVKLLN